MIILIFGVLKLNIMVKKIKFFVLVKKNKI